MENSASNASHLFPHDVTDTNPPARRLEQLSVPQQVRHELQMALAQACSKDQLELCDSAGILSKSEQHRLMQCAKRLSGPTWTQHDINATIECVVSSRDRYSRQMDLAHIRQLPSREARLRLLDEFQRQSDLLDQYGEANLKVDALLRSIRRMRDSWKQDANLPAIVASIVSSSAATLERCRLIRTQRSHLRSLGFGLRSLGRQYLVFDSHCTLDDCKQVVRNIAHDFAQVFQENVAWNFGTADNPSSLSLNNHHLLYNIQRMADRIFYTDSSDHTSTTLVPAELSSSASLGSVVTGLGTMAPIPVFEPAAWDWPQLLKQKNTFWMRPHTAHDPHRPWTCSIQRLADHFAKIAREYYSHMLETIRLTQSHQANTFEQAAQILFESHKALRIESGHANLTDILLQLYNVQNTSALRI